MSLRRSPKNIILNISSWAIMAIYKNTVHQIHRISLQNQHKMCLRMENNLLNPIPSRIELRSTVTCNTRRKKTDKQLTINGNPMTHSTFQMRSKNSEPRVCLLLFSDVFEVDLIWIDMKWHVFVCRWNFCAVSCLRCFVTHISIGVRFSFRTVCNRIKT